MRSSRCSWLARVHRSRPAAGRRQPSWRRPAADAPTAKRSHRSRSRRRASAVARYNEPRAGAAARRRSATRCSPPCARPRAKARHAAAGRRRAAVSRVRRARRDRARGRHRRLQLVEFALQRNGIIEPSPHLLVVWGDVDRAELIVEQLRAAARRDPRRRRKRARRHRLRPSAPPTAPARSCSRCRARGVTTNADPARAARRRQRSTVDAVVDARLQGARGCS